MLLRLVYEKVKKSKVETLRVPIRSQSEISLKANILSAVCEEDGVTHNFKCERYEGRERGWADHFIPEVELMRIL